MKLTPDRKKIQNTLNGLKTIETAGESLMEKGFEEVNEELQEAHKLNPRTNSLIIAVNTAPPKSSSIPMIKSQVQKAQKMRGIVYFVGFNKYDRDKLADITGKQSHVYGTEKVKEMEVLYKSLVANSCEKAMARGIYFMCLYEYYDVEFLRPVPDPSNKEKFVCQYFVGGKRFPNRKALEVTERSIMCPGHIIETDKQKVIVRYSMDGGNSFLGKMVFQGNDCTDKEPPPVEKIERESETCIQTCNMVIVPCCRYQQDNVRHIEDKLDTLCDFVQTCNQLPLMRCQPRDQGWCFNFTPVKPLCRQLPCLPPNQGCFPLNSCCSECQHPPTIYSHPPSRMLPLISPSAEALCRPTLSLPPP
ncbi:anthrax toxin receptor-like [Mirounga leonina]|uniref:anthrax toxin receptor-like n=1 Tax=Mirounga leonina TaxID=9715 RepID=UPI00156BE9DB|nr:anthrax toxin receptor-like [Mirounga leonina]